MNRLETIAPGMTGLIEKAPSFVRHKVLTYACTLAIESAKVKIDFVLKILREFQISGFIVERIRDELELLVNEIDEEYFTFQDEGDEDSALKKFRQARAVSALAFAGGGVKIDNALEAVYEAAAAMDNSGNFINKLHEILSEF